MKISRLEKSGLNVVKQCDIIAKSINVLQLGLTEAECSGHAEYLFLFDLNQDMFEMLYLLLNTF